MAAIQNWMKGLQPTRKLVELCLPGSHDAGAYRDLRSLSQDRPKQVKPGAMVRCQFDNIWEQAKRGSRVFDIRVFLEKVYFKSTDGYTEIPTMGHFLIEGSKGYLGDYGGTLMTALHDAAHFLQENLDEFIIFRIGHTECAKEVADVLTQFRVASTHKDESDDYAKHRKGVIYTGAKGNVADLQYEQLKGKLLLIFDNQFKDSPFGPEGPDNGYDYRYEKYPNYPEMPSIGLSFCGEYSGGLGDKAAFWKKGNEKGNWKSESADQLGHDGCENHQKDHADRANHLLWVYWQRTGGNIWDHTTQDRHGMHARLGDFLNDLSTNKNKFAMPNVIGHDFVTKETCTKIVKLNPDLKDTNFT